ncbi:glutathione S-transferase [Litorivita pollutaquae]|uniref:Glutathione S-transferase n=1 Tax=Litorivita pollutaquae TaxID=2200892 RepID=A0A2V4NFF9_9RHOB|nr:glutathione S-transferase family protein [Litorivita pollutaquae]OUS22667.1 glutathione S-transferase [Rhodobacterales bacterium 59_46_T64]PYC48670.1 glutathione S-transferase [Litorivita pollutaquae]
MITLHHVPQSRSMRVLWLLGELDLPFQVVSHGLDKGLRDPEYLTVSPAGRVPALEIDGERMFESLAIVQYLCERYAEAPLYQGPGDIDRMAWLVWVQFAETISQHTSSLAQQHIALREDHMRSPTVMRIEAKRIENCYAAIEARLSTPVENRDYLLTGGFSAADVCTGQAVYMARHFVSTDAFPEVSAWYERITERPAFQASLPQGEVMNVFERDFYPPWDS